EDAQAYLVEAFGLLAEIGIQLLQAFVLEALAWLAFASPEIHDSVGAAQIFSAAEHLRKTTGARKPPQWKALLDRILTEIQATLGADAFANAWETGERLLPDAALSLFDSEASTPTRSQYGSQTDPLSPRETDVLRLVATGLTDAEVAAQLVLSVRTV